MIPDDHLELQNSLKIYGEIDLSARFSLEIAKKKSKERLTVKNIKKGTGNYLQS